MIKIEIYTDGACNQVAKTGGWSFIMIEDGIVKLEKSGSEVDTTNNKCEMLAAIKSLEEFELLKFTEPTIITIYSDSAYLVNAFNQDWISGWLKNGWINSRKESVLNRNLWEALISYQKKHNVIFVQIKRRSNDLAKRVDFMAKKPTT